MQDKVKIIKKTARNNSQIKMAKLREAELLYHSLFNQASDGSLLIDTSGNILDFNEAAHQQLGYTREEFAVLHLTDINPFQKLEEIQSSIQKNRAEGSAEFEVRHKTKKGDIRDVHVITRLMSLSGRTFYHTIWRDITKQKRVDRELIELNTRLQALIYAIPDIVIFKDRHGRHLVVNKATEEFIGLSREKLIGKTNEELLPPDLAAFCDKSDEIAMGSHVPTRTEEKAVGTNGEQIILDTIKVPIRDASGNLTGLITVSRNITERKRMEDALHRSEANYRALMEQASDGIAVIDRQGHYLDVNSRMCDMMGYSHEEFLKLTVTDALAPEELLASPPRIPELLAGNVVLSERLMRRKDGSVFPVEISAKMVPEGRLCGIHRDITDRRRAEEALRKSEKFTRDILETVDEGFIIIDRDYRIQSANKAYLDQVKMTMEEVKGRYCYKISHHNDKACYEMGEECAVKHTFDAGEPHTAIHIHADNDGNSVYVETKSYPLKDESGNTFSAIEIINDVTEKKKLEEQLRQSQKMEAVGQLAGGIAHDFNNILTAISGYGSLMISKMIESDPSRYYLEQMLDATRRAANLTRGLLTFSRKQVGSPEPVDLNKIIANVEKLLRHLVSVDIEMAVHLLNDEVTVMADSSQMEQVLMNMVANAKDAMPDRGSLTIGTDIVTLDRDFVKMHGYGKPGRYALISITDTGTGMDEKTKKRIFEPFFTTKEVGKGTGLGLSIVYGIVKQHNGYITCYSEQGEGTTFRIYLPIINRESRTVKTGELAPITGGTEAVLIAEDDVAVRKLLKEMLEPYGYTVILAVDGEHAISAFMKHRDKIRLLILDVIMPKKNGKEVYEEIRKKRPDVKVIFTSGYTADILLKKEIHEKHLNFVSKPIVPNELLRRVREVLDK